MSRILKAAAAAVLLASGATFAIAQSSTTAPPNAPEANKVEPAAPMKGADTQATPPAKVESLIGLAVTSSDGTKLGTVQSVNTQDGKVTAILIKTGGFLGFGAKLVAIPQAKFTRTGNNVQLAMTAEEVGKLPEVKTPS